MALTTQRAARGLDVTVQLATRISPESREKLDQVVAAQQVHIRTFIEEAILERWTALQTAPGGVSNV